MTTNSIDDYGNEHLEHDSEFVSDFYLFFTEKGGTQMERCKSVTTGAKIRKNLHMKW